MSILRRAIPSRRILSTGSVNQKARQRAWNQVNRRSYASGGHGGEYKPPSDVPWAITSLVVTIPVASWIWSQGPSRNKPGEGDHHGHDDHSKDDSHDAEEEEAGSEDSKEDAKDAEKEDSKAEPEDQKDDAKSDAKEQDKPDEDAEKDTQKDSNEKSDSESDSGDEGKDTPATSDDEDSGKEDNDGPKAATAAMHKGKPHDDKSLSKKSEGVHDTAKLTETVDPFRPAK